MGGTVSTVSSVSTAEKIVHQADGTSTSRIPTSAASAAASEAQMVTLLMPLYYTTEPMTAEETSAAKKAWNMIVGNQCQNFFDFKKANPHRPCRFAAQYLHTCFYQRLFTVHPSCKALFVKASNSMNLTPTISLILTKLDHPENFEKSLQTLVAMHNKMGVKAAEYGIVGECLMFAIQCCVGQKEFTDATNRGWCKIFSKMMTVIIPAVVAFEVKNPSLAKEHTLKRYAMARESIARNNGSNEQDALLANATLLQSAQSSSQPCLQAQEAQVDVVDRVASTRSVETVTASGCPVAH